MNSCAFSQPQIPDLDQLMILVRRKDCPFVGYDSLQGIMQAIMADAQPPEIEKMVSRSPEVMARIVRVASSPAYGAKPVSSLTHALDLLGTKETFNITLSVWAFLAAGKVPKLRGFDIGLFQRHCLAQGVLSRLLAAKFKAANPEAAFVAGIFLDFGYLVFGAFMPHQLERVIATSAKTRDVGHLAIERHYIGYDHTEVGKRIATEFGLDPKIVEAIGNHHDPAMADVSVQPFADMMHLVVWLTEQMDFRVFPDAPNEFVDDFAFIRLGTTREEFDSLLVAAKEVVQRTVQTME